MKKVSKFTLAVLLLLLTMHTAGALSANMEFHASFVPDTVHPGELTKLTVIIDNDAKANGFPLNENTSRLLKVITTAYNVRANISGDLPFIVENAHEQIVGTIPQGVPRKTVFIVKVPNNAEEGPYTVPIELEYTQIVATPVSSTVFGNSFQLTYLSQHDTIYAKINIVKKDFDANVESNSNVVAGAEGIVRLKITNTGRYKLYNVSLIINASPPFMPNPGAVTAYVGDLNPGQSKIATFKVFVSQDAVNQTYPVKVIVVFNTPGGKPVMFMKQVGIKVVNKNTFSFKIIKSQISRFIALPPTTGLGSALTPSQSITSASSHSISPPIASHIPTKSLKTGAQSVMPAMSMFTLSHTHSSPNGLPSVGYLLLEIRNNGESVRDVTANLVFTNPLITAVNNPYIGNLKHGQVKKALFYIRSFAPTGIYKAYVFLSYKNSLGDNVVSKKYPIAIEVSNPPFKILDIKTKNLNVGNVGEVDVNITGNIRNASFYLLSPDPSIKPVSLSSYASTPSSTLKFRVYVSSQAVDGYHCLYLVGRYDEGNATNLVSTIKLPVYVQSKTVLFRVTSVKSIGLYPDYTGTVKVTVENAGNSPIYNAVVQLGIMPPLSIAGESAIGSMIGVSTPGSYFIGTLKPGQSATATFRIKVDKHAGAGNYPANVKIMYYDGNGYKHVSNSITVSVEVKNRPLLTPLTTAALLLVGIGIVVAARYARRKRKERS